MSETTHSLPIARLRESRSQPRKTYNPVKLQELADSIKAQGVMQPIVVRSLPEDSPLRFESASSCALVFDFEIVFGHRRSRAANLAGLEFIPTFIRDMDDEQVALAQIHENLERDDVHPIEEADAFMTLMDRHNVTADQLVAQTGKSRSYIYGQIKMARKLGPEVREACLANVIGSEIALLIARYCPSHKLQPKALEAVMVKQWDGSEMIASAMSARSAKHRLRRDFCIHIEAAPFDRDSRDLVADADACGTCPKLAANDPELADELDADVCTDADCYRGKCRAHVDSKIAEARAAGRTVIDGEDALKLLPNTWTTRPLGHVLISDVALESQADDQASTITFAQGLAELGDQAPAPFYIVHPHSPGVLLECLPREQADTVTDALVVSTGTTTARKASAQETWEERHRREDAEYLAGLSEAERPFHQHRAAIERAVFEAAAARTHRTAFDLLVVCRTLTKERYDFDEQLIQAMGWTDEMHTALSDEDADGEPKKADHEDEESFVCTKLATCDSDQLARFAVLISLLSGPGRFGTEGLAELRTIAEHYEVDVTMIAAPEASDEDGRDDAETNPPLLPAARAADGGYADAEDTATTTHDQPAAPAPAEQAAPAAKKPSRAKAKNAAPAAPEQIDDAGSAGEQATASASKSKKRSAKTATPPASEQTDEAGSAGLERDPRVQDMFDGVPA